MDSVFERIDSQTWGIGRFSPFAILRNARTWRRFMAACAFVAAIGWVVFGWDSTLTQVQYFIFALPKVITGQMSFADVWEAGAVWYGLGQHLSGPVIYGIAYVVLSLHLEKHSITRSQNFLTSAGLSFMSVGLFELAYNVCYATFQGQSWVVSFMPNQGITLTHFIAYVAIGAVVLLYLAGGGYYPNMGRRTAALAAFALALWLLWIFYPLPTTPLTIETSTGAWTSGARFPQTMYAIDLTPADSEAAGFPFFVEDTIVHLVNTATKAASTLAILSFCCGRKVASHLKEVNV